VGVRHSYLKAVAIFRTALQLPPMHEPPQQGRPMLAWFCFSDEATTAFGWNLLQSRLMAFPPFLPKFSYRPLWVENPQWIFF